MGPVRQNPIHRTVRSVHVCAVHCVQLLHTILHRTDLIIFPLTLQTITIALMMSIWGKGGPNRDKTCVVPCIHSSFSDRSFDVTGPRVCGTVYHRPCDKTLATNSLTDHWTHLYLGGRRPCHSRLFACMHHTNILHNYGWQVKVLTHWGINCD